MPTETQQRVYDLLRAIPERGISAVKQLFWSELNYDRVGTPLSYRDWPERVRQVLAEPPTLLARHGSGPGSFSIVYGRLTAEVRGREFPLSLTAERLAISQLLPDHPYALFLFSDPDESHWHLVNVRYEHELSRRRVFRRIAVGPNERLRTASERVAMLNLATMSPDLFGLSPIAIQQRHDEAFNVEAVTDQFFAEYRQVFESLQAHLRERSRDPDWAHDYALQFLNRLMFLYYVQRKRWLGDDPDFLSHLVEAYQRAGRDRDTFVNEWLFVLFFEAFNNRFQVGQQDRQYLPQEIRDALAVAPYLNGGLFESDDLDQRHTVRITDDLFLTLFRSFERYNFTISEDTPLDQEVAVDPEMIGRVYESLVNVSTEADERQDAGIFYTPRVEIDLMCRLALVERLTSHLGARFRPLLYEAVFAFDLPDKEQADAVLAEHNLWPQLNDLLRNLTVVDPACGSGSFLVGMLYVLDDLLARADQQLGLEETPYERKKRIIGNSLYGVDVMDWAVHVAELRLWLQLVIDTSLAPAELQSHPLLPNLSFKLRIGDSLLQEVGGIDLSLRRRSGAIPLALQGRITHLKAEKLQFYNNTPERHYRTAADLELAEFQLFREILEARAKTISDRFAEIESLLRPRVNLFGEIQDPQLELDRLVLERERERLETEYQQVAHARQALRGAKRTPFVWDIAFVEVFEGERSGFDIVIGNPPYVRQERIHNPLQPADSATAESKKEYKTKLARSVYSVWPQTFGYDWATGRPRWKLSAKSDLYLYFYLHGLSLLNPEGSFCFITSNSWLDVGYGKDLQEFLLTRGRIGLVVDNRSRRSFTSAEVNTVIVLLGPAQDSRSPNAASLQHLARFVMLTVPFEHVLSPIAWEEIDECTSRKATPEYRLFPMSQADLLHNGTDPESQEYVGDRWGAKYLRAPDIYWVVYDACSSNTVKLGSIAEVRFGIKSGANEFFHLDSSSIAQWGIERRFLRPLIKTPRDYYSITIPPQADWHLFWCQEEKRALRGRSVLGYIKWGEGQQFHKRPSCRGRSPWYALSGPTKPNMLWPSAFFERYICYECPQGFVADKVFYTITSPDLPTSVKAFLNSSVVALFVEVEGYQLNHGGVFVTTEWLANLPVLAIDDPAMEEAYQALSQQEVLLYEDEVRQPARIALDAAVLRALGLPADLLGDLHQTVAEHIQNRITKARRSVTQKGRRKPQDAE